MQGMRCGKGNLGTHSMWMPGIGRDKDTDLGLCQDESGSDKIGVAEWYLNPRLEGWTAE